jgi:hypothetical protein
MSPKAADVAPMFHAATTTFFCAMRENDLTLVKPDKTGQATTKSPGQ